MDVDPPIPRYICTCNCTPDTQGRDFDTDKVGAEKAAIQFDYLFHDRVFFAARLRGKKFFGSDFE